MSLRLVRLPSGAWGLFAVPGEQRLETALREPLTEVPALTRRPPAVPVAA